VNPLTAIGFVETFKSLGGKGLIHTAAASSLGRQLNRLARKENIPILNIVRRQEHADLLKSEGAQHVIITQGDWVEEYKKNIETHGFNVVFDALGGGPVTDSIISNLRPNSYYFGYGVLERKPLTVSNLRILFSEITIKGFFLTNWWIAAGQ
jgi:NADPH2:quinone reductase